MKIRETAGRREKAAVLLLALLAVAGLLHMYMARGADGAVAEVVLDGAVAVRMKLSEDREYTVPGNPQVQLRVRDGHCGFVHSDCPDQICVQAGFLGSAGQTAACLPNRVLLRIVGEESSRTAAPDTVAR